MDRYSNLAISRVTNDDYERGDVYECSQIYNGMIDIVTDNNDLICHNANTDDFIIFLNVDYVSSKFIKDMRLQLI